MSRDPFDEFKEIKKLFQKMMGNGELPMGGTGYSISVKQTGDKTEVDVRGDISEKEIKKLKRKYPNAEISVNGSKTKGSKPVEVLSEEKDEDIKEEEREKKKIEEIDEEDLEPEELALKRFKEREKEKK